LTYAINLGSKPSCLKIKTVEKFNKTLCRGKSSCVVGKKLLFFTFSATAGVKNVSFIRPDCEPAALLHIETE